ncbi:hypothetical protein LMG26788_03236 [Achromobacter pulmonis]|uniref:Lipoprotein n=1 Tax=Achromobacter pulmonis TaxID=1389932 RepID=A0A6S7DRI9_9BURK|nr:hypothetical protein [Achromobacter pulmonis]CAB3880053.1 hypothetical protein LMG26788_03236 [Achromobacter pulmonis]
MAARARWAWAGLMALALMAGCDERPAPSGLDPQSLRDLAPEHEFRGRLNGQAVHLVVSDCVVYLDEADPASGARRWVKVLEPEFYPSLMSCARQSLQAKAPGVEAFVGRQALGAGGCCSSGGRYYSTDGRSWTRR